MTSFKITKYITPDQHPYSYSTGMPYKPPKHSDLYQTLKKRRAQRNNSQRGLNKRKEAYATLFLCALALAYFLIALAIN